MESELIVKKLVVLRTLGEPFARMANSQRKALDDSGRGPLGLFDLPPHPGRDAARKLSGTTVDQLCEERE